MNNEKFIYEDSSSAEIPQEGVEQENLVPASNRDNTGEVISLLQNATNLYAQCMIVEQQTEQVKHWSEAKIIQTVAKYRSCQEFLAYTFGERDKALTKHYNLLDKAVADGYRAMIVEALRGISGIVTTSPLSDFDEFVKLYEDTSVPLLDF